jgi:isoleucyl-tRNA synthetase
MAPILPFTADEAWEAMPGFRGKGDSVHLETFPEKEEAWLDAGVLEEGQQLVLIREKVLKELEKAREAGLIGNSLEARIILKVPSAQLGLLKRHEKDLSALFIVSGVELKEEEGEEIGVEAARAEGEKCRRCWNYSTYVGTSAEFPHFCRRCEDVIRQIPR